MKIQTVVRPLTQDTLSAIRGTVPDHVPTAQSVREKFESLPEAAVALILKAGAPARHEWRVKMSLFAAAPYPMEGIHQDNTAIAAAMAGNLVVDMIGLGGQITQVGQKTDRLLGSLGKGRWQATDGAAWMAASKAAIERLVAFGVQFGVDEARGLVVRYWTPNDLASLAESETVQGEAILDLPPQWRKKMLEFLLGVIGRGNRSRDLGSELYVEDVHGIAVYVHDDDVEAIGEAYAVEVLAEAHAVEMA